MEIDKSYIPYALRMLDKGYVEGGKWKCGKSPTGAHYWVQDKGFKCKYCNKTEKK